MKLETLVGSGRKIGLFTLPFLLVGIVLNLLFPSWFSVGGPSFTLMLVSIVVLSAGLAVWMWCVVLIVTRIPRGELITVGPYSVVKHPLYTNASFFLLPWVGFLFDTWLGVPIGIVAYVGDRIFSPDEENSLSKTFGTAWNDYCRKVKIPWV